MVFCALMEEVGDETTSDRISTRDLIMILNQRQSAGPAITTAESGALPSPDKSSYPNVGFSGPTNAVD
jgi:hypothetical protein